MYLETAHPLEFSNVAIVSQSPLRAAVRAEVKHSQSTVSVMVCTFFLERLGELDRNLSYVDISQCHGRFVVFLRMFFDHKVLNGFRLLLAMAKENSRSLFDFDAIESALAPRILEMYVE